MPPLCKPGGANTDAEDPCCPVVIAINASGLDQRMACLSLAQGLSLPVTAHGALPPVGIKPVEGSEKGFTANIRPKAFDIAFAGEAHERRC
jgi:hypothetical protein